MNDFEKSIRAIVRSIVVEELRAATPPPPEWLDVAAYARRWSISTTTVRRAITERRLASMRIGRAVRVRADAEIARRAQDKTGAELAVVRGGK